MCPRELQSQTEIHAMGNYKNIHETRLWADTFRPWAHIFHMMLDSMFMPASIVAKILQ